MKQLLLVIVLLISAGTISLSAKIKSLEENRAIVSKILNKIQLCDDPEDKIVFGLRDKYYLIIDNHTFTEYFVVVNNTENEIESITTTFNSSAKKKKYIDKYFKSKTYIDDQNNIGEIGEFGTPAYIAYVEGNNIISDMTFFSISIPSPVPITVLLFLNKEIIIGIDNWENRMPDYDWPLVEEINFQE